MQKSIIEDDDLYFYLKNYNDIKVLIDILDYYPEKKIKTLHINNLTRKPLTKAFIDLLNDREVEELWV